MGSPRATAWRGFRGTQSPGKDRHMDVPGIFLMLVVALAATTGIAARQRYLADRTSPPGAAAGPAGVVPAPADQRSLIHEQGDDHLLQRPRHTGRHPRGRSGRRDLHRARALPRRGRNNLQGEVPEGLPGMQSSFIDIGLERDAFLYVTEVVNTVEEFDRLESGEDEDEEDDDRA